MGDVQENCPSEARMGAREGHARGQKWLPCCGSGSRGENGTMQMRMEEGQQRDSMEATMGRPLGTQAIHR